MLIYHKKYRYKSVWYIISQYTFGSLAAQCITLHLSKYDSFSSHFRKLKTSYTTKTILTARYP